MKNTDWQEIFLPIQKIPNDQEKFYKWYQTTIDIPVNKNSAAHSKDIKQQETDYGKRYFSLHNK